MVYAQAQAQPEVVEALKSAVPIRMNLEAKRDGRKKGRLIVQGFKEMLKFLRGQTDSPVANLSTIRSLLFLGWVNSAGRIRSVNEAPGFGWGWGAAQARPYLDFNKRSHTFLGWEEETIISSIDLISAFIQTEHYGPEEPPRYVSFKSHKNAKREYYRLKGPLYGQRDAPMRWYLTIQKWLIQEGFTQGANDPCIFVKSGIKVVLLILSMT